MCKLIFLLLPFIMVGKVMAISPADAVADEVLLANAKNAGIDMYQNCILITPATDDQRAACDARRVRYNIALIALNAPAPLVLTKDPSQYVASPWDVCRYEVTHTVFDTNVSKAVPYCATPRI